MKSLVTGYSKKLVAFFVYLAVVLLNKQFELGLSEGDVYALTGGMGAYALSQGIADAGKEAEKVRKAP